VENNVAKFSEFSFMNIRREQQIKKICI